MRLQNRDLIAAIAAVSALLSYGAISAGTQEAPAKAPVDRSAFAREWSGEYYVEPAESSHEKFESFEARKKHFLESDQIGREVEEFEEDEQGKWIPLKKEGPRPGEDAVELPQASSDQVAPYPSPQPSSAPFFSNPPSWTAGSAWDVLRPSGPQVPYRFEEKSEENTETKKTENRASQAPQAFYFYNSGYLRNASQLPDEGKGFMKVFRDRDAARGGRGWGTRSMIDAIEEVAAQFMNRFPGRERIQVADIAGKSGGNIGHGSHKNGLDADIVFIRKNKKEQLAYGGHGKNGFAEQFVVTGPATVRTYRDSRGRKRVKKVYSRKTSGNFDVAANFELLKLFDKQAEVKVFFVDQVLIRELFRYAENQGLADDPETRTMLEKLDHEPSHADHVHVRLKCQSTDTSCRSANGRMPSTKSKSSGKKPTAKKPAPKTVAKKR